MLLSASLFICKGAQLSCKHSAQANKIRSSSDASYTQIRSGLWESLYNWLQAQEAASGLSAAAARSGEGWAGDIRSGLFMVLASRVGQQQRHSALRLAAALLDLVQPHWLLGPVHAVSHVLLSVFYCHGAVLLQ